MKITILAFNFGPTRSFTNGPGMSLYVFCKAISREFDIDLFTDLKPEVNIPGVSFFSSKDSASFKRSIKSSYAIHHWSGITKNLQKLMRYVSNKKIILGPNLFDCVEIEKEREYLNHIDLFKVLSVNDRIKYNICFNHDIHHQRIKTFIVGPDEDLWYPSGKTDKFILWKGNSTHKAKDISFALRLKDKLSQYDIRLVGYPNPYKYFDHIDEAKRACLYVSTSISETKSQTLMESWASGIPSVTHPKIYLHGINYETGIITNKNLNDYSEAIREVMDNKVLRNRLSEGAMSYVKNNLSKNSILCSYKSIL